MINWLIQRAADDPQVAAGFPPEHLLSAPETIVYDSLHSAKRRKDWLLGRWTAKRLVQAAAKKSGARHLACREISILAAKDGAPQVWLDREEQLSCADFTISISHSHGVSLCAVVTPAAYLLGADIERIERRSLRFVEDYFTEEEQERVRQAPTANRDFLISATWSGKEAALKAVRQGLRLDTRVVSCGFPSSFHPGGYSQEIGNWRPFTVRWSAPRAQNNYPHLSGWWRVWQKFILTLVVTKKPQRVVGDRIYPLRH